MCIRDRALSDADLLEKIRRSKKGPDFEALWSGQTAGHGEDHSAADLALANILSFWTNGDAARMDRLFRQSSLMREKWDKPHYADAVSYTHLDVYKRQMPMGAPTAKRPWKKRLRICRMAIAERLPTGETARNPARNPPRPAHRSPNDRPFTSNPAVSLGWPTKRNAT